RGELLDRALAGTAALRQPAIALPQSRASRKRPRLLRSPRRQGRGDLALPSHHPHLRALRGRHGAHAPARLPGLQCGRRGPLDRGAHLCGLFLRQHPVDPRQPHRDHRGDRRREPAAARLGVRALAPRPMIPVAETHVAAITHAIQLAIAPVFLLTAVGTIINALISRLARAVDRRRQVEEILPAYEGIARENLELELAILARRIVIVMRAIALAVLAALLVC